MWERQSAPPPVASETKTPVSPNPTMSAMPSPFTSASSRGYWSWLFHPPAPDQSPQARMWRRQGIRLRSRRETKTPAWPNPTMSAMWSPFTSASSRGYWCRLAAPTSGAGPKPASSYVGAARCRLRWPARHRLRLWPNATMSAVVAVHVGQFARIGVLAAPAAGARAEAGKLVCGGGKVPASGGRET